MSFLLITTSTYGNEEYDICGKSSWYGPGFNGKRTASGETYNQNSLTAAHKTLAFGTEVIILNPENNKQITVKINDRGPYHKGRIIDVSKEAADQLGFRNKGVTKLCLKILDTQ